MTERLTDEREAELRKLASTEMRDALGEVDRLRSRYAMLNAVCLETEAELLAFRSRVAALEALAREAILVVEAYDNSHHFPPLAPALRAKLAELEKGDPGD